MLWIDAHADMNTPDTSPSGNIHGMPLAAVLGMGAPELVNVAGIAPKLAPENTVLIGIRDVDAAERQIVMDSGVTYYEMMKIDVKGLGAVMREALDIALDGTAGIHVSLDVDAIDPEYAPGVGTPVAGGLTIREVHLLMEMIADTGKMMSFEVAELNPILDHGNETADLVCELIASGLGKKVMGSSRPPPRQV
jgi:arginase